MQGKTFEISLTDEASWPDTIAVSTFGDWIQAWTTWLDLTYNPALIRGLDWMD